MPEKWRARASGARSKGKMPTQTTLKDLFQRTNSGTAPTENEREPHTEPAVACSQADESQPPAQPSKQPPTRLYPIFTKVAPMQERPRNAVIKLDDTAVIDITDLSSDLEVSTEPSACQPSPRSEFSQVTSHSPPPSPILLSDTSFPHVGTRGLAPFHKSNKRASGSGLGDVPLPSSCSQHVRGMQHSYTSSQAHLKRRARPGFGPSDGLTLDFLAKRRYLDDTTPIPPGCIRKSLAPQQCEEHFRSLSRDCIDAHPAFAQVFVQREGIPSQHAEMWTRRFRPRCANEVLGNEQRAIYLRDWLRALKLHLQGHKPEEPASKRSRENNEKSSSKRAESRGMKRPRIVRAVTRKRGNKKRRVDSDDDLGDFVVLSEADKEEADDLPEDSEDDLAFCQRTLKRLHRQDTVDTQDVDSATSDGPDTEIKHTTTRILEPVQTNFTDNLTNALLIAGPPGCGKTAAVYACAEELGWEIFEVYPGIGRRNGASLDQLVGDVGKNHIVQTMPKCPKITTVEAKEPMGLRGYLGREKAKEFAGLGKSQGVGTEAQPIDIEGNSPRHELVPLPPDQEKDSSDEAADSGKCHAEIDGSKPIVVQSLVLLEEVDILFKEDGGFWAAVVDLIRCSQRPVVMTCNDPGLVPLGDLPLQTVLVFEPCPSTVAATFLQCVSLMEGCVVPHEDLMALYEGRDSKYGLEVPDAADYWRTEPVGLRDLRRTITQLQMLCAGARHGSTSEMHQGDEAEGHVRRSAGAISAASRVTAMGSRVVEGEWWREMKRQSEVMSRVDAELCRVEEGTGEVAPLEEEMGYVVLEEREGLAFWERDELIAEEAIRQARGVHEDDTGPSRASINPARGLDAEGGARVGYRSRMEGALEGVLGRRSGESVFLDYIPWVRHMVLVDDALERRALAGRAGGRCTRNSLRSVHARTVDAREGERDLLRRTRLCSE